MPGSVRVGHNCVKDKDKKLACGRRAEPCWDMWSNETITHGGNREAVTSICCIRTFKFVATKHFPLYPRKVMMLGLALKSMSVKLCNKLSNLAPQNNPLVSSIFRLILLDSDLLKSPLNTLGMIKWGLLWTKANESFRQGTHPVDSQKQEMLASIATADWAPEMGAFWGIGPLLSRTAALTDGILLQQMAFYSYWSRQGLTSYWEHLGRSQ